MRNRSAGSATGPINIASADLRRRPSDASAGSFPGFENIAGSFGSVESHVPHFLCKCAHACMDMLTACLRSLSHANAKSYPYHETQTHII